MPSIWLWIRDDQSSKAKSLWLQDKNSSILYDSIGSVLLDANGNVKHIARSADLMAPDLTPPNAKASSEVLREPVFRLLLLLIDIAGGVAQISGRKWHRMGIRNTTHMSIELNHTAIPITGLLTVAIKIMLPMVQPLDLRQQSIKMVTTLQDKSLSSHLPIKYL